jgi:phosphosulfolactate synthase (CoM biosynthesis protein A)
MDDVIGDLYEYRENASPDELDELVAAIAELIKTVKERELTFDTLEKRINAFMETKDDYWDGVVRVGNTMKVHFVRTFYDSAEYFDAEYVECSNGECMVSKFERLMTCDYTGNRTKTQYVNSPVKICNSDALKLVQYSMEMDLAEVRRILGSSRDH